jgi:DNA-binding NarL/FixJ family response regulator
MDKIRILLVDDHAVFRQGLMSLLREEEYVEEITEAHTGEHGVRQYKQLLPDIVVVDMSMPDMNGIEVSKKILAINPQASIIILSMHDGSEYISRCMELGVKGYIVKTEHVQEVKKAIRSVMGGQLYFGPTAQKAIFEKFSLSSYKKNSKLTQLTEREREILLEIQRGLTSQQIADKLFISHRTVETHRTNLFKKCNAKNSIDLIRKVEELGLL